MADCEAPLTVIKARKLQLGMTTAELGRLTDSYPSNLYRIEGGNSKAGKPLRGRIAVALGMPVEDLFDAQGWPLYSAVPTVG